jgi:5-methylcytosine-specific restriction endonuclease McrBC regulatory subunit McrC
MDGLAWVLPLQRLWEDYVCVRVAERVRTEGGVLRIGRKGETTTPLTWSDPGLRSLGHLVPDIVVTRADSVWVVDAKYKSHFVEIDEDGWRRMADDIRDSHRADIHQVLAYSTLFDSTEVTASLAYPLRWHTWESLKQRGLDRAAADIYHGARHIRLELWGMPFGSFGRTAA